MHLIKNDIECINSSKYINYILNENCSVISLSFYKIKRTFE